VDLSTFVVMATGQSLTAEQVEAVRHLPVVVVNNAFERAPWAMALAAQDKSWWRAHPRAKQFAGRKFSTRPIEGVEKVPIAPLTTSSNSGLLGVHVARMLGASRVLLLGVDLHGTHYFGPYRNGLANTVPSRFENMKKQFARYPRGELRIINCSPGSALTCFPFARLSECLASP
jgi:hypothetical protein